MSLSDLKTYQTRIQTRLADLSKDDQSTSADRATVTLDQQSVGRLSRMDALQQQAMANANHLRRQQEKTRLKAALQRLNDGSFGDCLDCGDRIAQARLDLDPTVIRCMSCACG